MAMVPSPDPKPPNIDKNILFDEELCFEEYICLFFKVIYELDLTLNVQAQGFAQPSIISWVKIPPQAFLFRWLI